MSEEDTSNLYMDSGLEFTKKYNDNILARVRMRKTVDNDFEATVTVVQDHVIITKAKVRLEPQDVSLSAADTIALWASNAPFASTR